MKALDYKTACQRQKCHKTGISHIQLPARLSRVYESPKALPCCSQTCTDTWNGYPSRQKTAHQKQTRQVEGEFDMEIVSLIVQQLHAGVISLLVLTPIWLILLNLVTYAEIGPLVHL